MTGLTSASVSTRSPIIRTVELAMDGAADKLKQSIESTLGRLRDIQ